MNKRIESSAIISHLKSVSFVSSLKILAIDEVLTRSVLRIRCNLLPSSHHLDIRLIQTENETINPINHAYPVNTESPDSAGFEGVTGSDHTTGIRTPLGLPDTLQKAGADRLIREEMLKLQHSLRVI